MFLRTALQLLCSWVLMHPPRPEPTGSKPAPDFVNDEAIAKEWSDYVAKQESTRHHLMRCLNQ